MACFATGGGLSPQAPAARRVSLQPPAARRVSPQPAAAECMADRYVLSGAA